MENIDHEILFNILLRLPTSSLVHCRCVCKTWNTIVQDPYFANMHLIQAMETGNPSFVIRTLALRQRPRWYLADLDQKTPLIPLRKVSRVMHSLNGILCIRPLSPLLDVYLWNPFTGERVRLPEESPVSCQLAIGFDATANEYKVARITDDYKPPMRSTIIEIYTLGTPSWRIIANSPYPLSVAFVYANGTLYWKTDVPAPHPNTPSVPKLIVSLDMETEKFHLITFPDMGSITAKNWKRMALAMLRDRLALIDCSNIHYIDVWVMKDGSWSIDIRTAWPLLGGIISHPTVHTNNCEILLLRHTKGVVTYDLKRKKSKLVRFGGIPEGISVVHAHVASLISLKATVGGAKMIAEQKNMNS